MKTHRGRFLFVVGALLGVATATAAAALDERAVRKELGALYAQYGRLLKNEFRYPLKQFFLKHSTEDFLLKQDGKTYTREEAAELMEEGAMAMARFTGHDLKITSLTLKGDQAIVVYQDRATALMEDANENVHKIVMTSTTRDTWVKRPEGWMTRLTEVLTSKTLMNGKELKARPRPTSKKK
jgi:hypothetical protein